LQKNRKISNSFQIQTASKEAKKSNSAATKKQKRKEKNSLGWCPDMGGSIPPRECRPLGRRCIPRAASSPKGQAIGQTFAPNPNGEEMSLS